MNSDAPLVQPRTLGDFCAQIVARHAATWPPSEPILANAFAAHLGYEHMGSFEGLVRWCGSVGIQVSTKSLPHDVRGYHYWFRDKCEIFVDEDSRLVVSREHTVFHELRELMEHVFREMGFPTLGENALESHAEAFAMHTRTAVVLETSKWLFDGAERVQSTWGRRSAYLLVGVGKGMSH
jgi:hypothetical protein